MTRAINPPPYATRDSLPRELGFEPREDDVDAVLGPAERLDPATAALVPQLADVPVQSSKRH